MSTAVKLVTGVNALVTRGSDRMTRVGTVGGQMGSTARSTGAAPFSPFDIWYDSHTNELIVPVEVDLTMSTLSVASLTTTGAVTVGGALSVTGTSALAGNTTHTGAIILPVTAVAALGTTNANAAALGHGYNRVTAADDTVGVILPVMTPGEVIYVKSTVANKILKVYPFAGAAINALTATTGAISLASGPTPVIFVCDSATQIYTIPLLPS